MDGQDLKDGDWVLGVHARLFDVFGRFGTGLAAVDGGFGAPFRTETANRAVDVLIKAQQIADHLAVEESAVGVGVGQVGGLEIFVAEVFEDGFRGGQLPVR